MVPCSLERGEATHARIARHNKPPIEITPIDDIRFPDFLIQIMVKQQARDCQLPVANQVGIGGEIEFVALSERSIRVETVYRFDSYEAELQRIAENA